MSTLRLGAIVPANLNHALEVDVHAVGKLEGLEVGEADNGRARAKVLDLLEPKEETASLFFILGNHVNFLSLIHVWYILYAKIHFLYYYLFYTFILYFNVIVMYRLYILYYHK